jgi:hypothetical protein
MSDLLRHGPVIGPLCERPVPSWVTDGWYSNNSALQQLAIKHWTEPVTDAGEREAALRFVTPGESFRCSSCGDHRFPKPTVCFWCRRRA